MSFTATPFASSQAMTDAALLQTVSSPATLTSKIQTFQRKDSLPLIADRIWLIEQGAARVVTWNESGYVTTLGIWGRGDIIGQPLTHQHPCQVECLTPVKAIATSLDHHSRHWQTVLLRHLWCQEDLLRIIHQPSVLESLQQLLRWLAQRFGQPVPEGQLLDPLLTHQQIAEILGTSRVTVTRALTQLEKTGQLIKFNKSSGQWTGDAQFAFSRRTLLLVTEK